MDDGTAGTGAAVHTGTGYFGNFGTASIPGYRTIREIRYDIHTGIENTYTVPDTTLQNWLASRMGIEIDSTSVLGSNWLGFVSGVEIYLGLVSGPKVTCFSFGGQNWPCFCVCIANYLFLVSVWKLIWFLWWWLKLTWSQCGGSNSNWFQRGDGLDLVVV